MIENVNYDLIFFPKLFKRHMVVECIVYKIDKNNQVLNLSLLLSRKVNFVRIILTIDTKFKF